MSVRSFQPEDAPACHDLILRCLRQDGSLSQALRAALLRRESPETMIVRATRHPMLVYEGSRGVAGVGGIDLNEIQLLFVDPPCHGQGIGRRILQQLESMAPASFFRDIFVYAMIPACSFYRRMGFVSQGTQEFQLDGQTLETIYMSKRLRSESRSAERNQARRGNFMGPGWER